MTNDVCPTCGTPRMGSFRYCRSCGFDYDRPVAAAAAPVSAAGPIPAPAPTTAPMILGAAPDVAGSSSPPWPPAGGALTATPSAAAATPSAGAAKPSAAPAPSGDDVVVIKVRHLKLAAGVVLGVLIGAMLTGSFIVPFFGNDRLIVGAVAGILTIVASAYVGLRVSMVFAGR